MELSIGKKLAVSYLAIIILLLISMFFSIYSLDNLQLETNKIMTDTSAIDKSASNIYLSMINQQTGVRGYFITGDESFLESYYIGQEQIKTELINIENFFSIHPDIEKLVDEMKPQIFLLQQYYSTTVSLCRAGKIDEVRSRIDLGKSLFSDFQRINNKIQGEILEINDDAGRQMDLAKSRQKLFLVVLGAFVLITTVLLFYKLSYLVVKNLEQKDNLNKELEKLLTAQEEFLANVSHEFKTPLNVIFSSIQLIDFYNKNDLLIQNKNNLSKYISTVIQNCYRLTRLVNNIIDASKLESGFFHLNLRTVNIVSVVENITLSVAEYVEARGLTLIFDTDIEERIMNCDPHAIERIILNLISNSVKFTSHGDSINIYVSENEGNVLISVKDSGVGIDGDCLEDVFEKFKQIDKSFTRNREGSGIGLYLVKRLIEMHHGKISVNSEKDKGTEFIIKLPFEAAVQLDGSEKVTGINSKVEMIATEFADIYEA